MIWASLILGLLFIVFIVQRRRRARWIEKELEPLKRITDCLERNWDLVLADLGAQVDDILQARSPKAPDPTLYEEFLKKHKIQGQDSEYLRLAFVSGVEEGYWWRARTERTNREIDEICDELKRTLDSPQEKQGNQDD